MKMHCTQPQQMLEMLKLQQEILKTILSNQSTQKKAMDNIAHTQSAVISDIKDLKTTTAAPPVLVASPPSAIPQETLTPRLAPRMAPQDTSAPESRSARPQNPPTASQPANTTMAERVRQSMDQQTALESPQLQHEEQSCASSILYMGDSIFRNVYMEKIEKQAGAKVTVVKAYSSAYDSNKNNKFKSSNFTDLVPRELSKAKHDALVIQASSVDLTNYKTETNMEKQRQIAQTSNANMLSVATTATANHPEVQKVIVFERAPRFDELEELNEYANIDLYNQWLKCDKEFKDKIVIGKHNLKPHGRFARVQRLARWGDQRSHLKPDNLHLRGPSGRMKMTDSVLAVLASMGIIPEAGPTGYFKEHTSKSQSQPQEWQEAGGRRRGRRHGAGGDAAGRRQSRAPRRRQEEEPFQLPLRNRYLQGNY